MDVEEANGWTADNPAVDTAGCPQPPPSNGCKGDRCDEKVAEKGAFILLVCKLRGDLFA